MDNETLMSNSQAGAMGSQSGSNITFNNPMKDYGNSIIMLTNPGEDIREIECTFRNVQVDENDKIRTLGPPLMNEYGVSKVIGQIKSIINRNVWAWIEDRKEIDDIRNLFADTLIKDLMVNRKNYDIKDVSARDCIVTESVILVHLYLKRAFKQRESNFWKGSSQTVRTEVVASDQKKNWLGWMSRK